MSTLILLCLTAVGYIVAYHTYGRFLARRIFKLNSTHNVPSHVQRDDKDFIPTPKHIVFGHHFTSIAGTGPIVGPAIGVIWGWAPAILWVFFGSIFMGAVHDFSSLVISMRNQGKSISECAKIYINPRVSTMFFVVVFLALWIVIAIFGLVVAIIFAQFPQAVIPVWLQIPISIGMGVFVFKKNRNVWISTFLALIAMAVSVVVGAYLPMVMPDLGPLPATGIWTLLLLIYAFFASVLPVSVLLQPRDFINAWQLYITLGIILIGIIVSSKSFEPIPAPAFNFSPSGAPEIWPFLFITIACGAISGFHCLVSSGTSSKQINSESDALYIGYGAMIIEAFLATIVIIAVTAGIGMGYTTKNGELLTGMSAWLAHYGSWTASAGLGSKLTAVVVGCANFMESIGISKKIGTAIIGVFIASFAGTTLDSATRVQRYMITEMFSGTSIQWIKNKYGATAIAIISAMVLAFSSGFDGKGALSLWPMFGAVNQLLGGLALLVATVYLRKKSRWSFLITGLPCIALMITTLWASWINQLSFIADGMIVVGVVNGVILILSLAILLETIKQLTSIR
jgi:carbon starvation protein